MTPGFDEPIPNIYIYMCVGVKYFGQYSLPSYHLIANNKKSMFTICIYPDWNSPFLYSCSTWSRSLNTLCELCLVGEKGEGFKKDCPQT